MVSRNTVQKRTIYAALCHLGNHPSADMVYDTLRESGSNISRSTVYRVLNQMADAGTVGKVAVFGAADRFDHRTDPHCHIRCSVCGRVEDVEVEGADALPGKINNSHGFDVRSCTIIFGGICPECQGDTANGH